MNYDFIYSLASEVVLMESKKIDKQGIKMKTTELGYKRKKYDELRKVFKLKPNNLIQANHGIYQRESNMLATKETFPTGLPDQKIMFEKLRDRRKLVGYG